TSVGSGTVELESTLPWLLITVPSGTPAFTVTRNVIVTVSPTRSGPTATDSAGAPDSSLVPRVVVSVPGTNVVIAGTVSVNTTSSTSRSRPLRTTVYSIVSPGRSRPPFRSTTVFWASTKAAAVARTQTLVSVVESLMPPSPVRPLSGVPGASGMLAHVSTAPLQSGSAVGVGACSPSRAWAGNVG